MMDTRDGPMVLRTFFKSGVGSMSNGLEEVFMEATNSVRFSRETGEKLFRVDGRGE